ncbi:nascent polypeptide-associated complex protein [Methanosarcinales archaeon]|nr:MAG: nascent polypeptide-associated complex protein [Methanosarcinales archaeon]
MMFPGKVDPRKMEKLMKQMGITVSELEGVEQVIIRTKDKDKEIASPSITVMEFQGQKTYQIVGNPIEKARVKEEDVELVVEQTGCTRDEAIKALEESKGDIAQAILSLKSE